MNEFMIHVERIVRPIIVPDDRKDRMREELLAHLQASFEQEQARQPDEALARSRAIAGLGDPARIRSELQDSVSRKDRFVSRIERLCNWRAPEPAWRYTLRVGIWTGAVFFGLLPIALITLFPLGTQPLLAALSMIAFMGLLISLNVFVLGFLYFKIRDSLLGAFGSPPSWLRAAGFLFASVAMVESSLLLFLWCVTGSLGNDLSLLLSQSLVACVLPVTGAFVAWVRGAGELRHAEWECLEI